MVVQQLLGVLVFLWVQVSSRSFSTILPLWAPHFLFSLRVLVISPGKSEADWMTEASFLTVQFRGHMAALLWLSWWSSGCWSQ